jgi:hypothetical protein
MKKTQWFAKGGDFIRMGPYKTQEEAARHLLIHAENCRCQRWPHRECDCVLRHIDGAFVWPEILESKPPARKTRRKT